MAVSKKVKVWGGVAAVGLLIGGAWNATHPKDDQVTAPAPTVAVSTPSVSPTPTKSAEPTKTADKAMTQDEVDALVEEYAAKPIAKDFEKAWLENLMVDKPVELLKTMPDSLSGYVTTFEDVSSDTIEITVQKNDVTKDELKAQARSMFMLVGSEFPELERVEVVSADRLTRGVANRHDTPMVG